MIYPINHPFYVLSDELLRLHEQELQYLIQKRHPSIWKLSR